jgi:TolB protein
MKAMAFGGCHRPALPGNGGTHVRRRPFAGVFNRKETGMRQLIRHGGTKSRFRALSAIALLAAGATLLADIGQSQSKDNFELVPRIAFSSVHNIPDCPAPPGPFPGNSQIAVGEIYLMNPDGPGPTNVQRLTDNDNCMHGDLFATLSGDGKKIVFDSNRLRSDDTDPLNTSDLFVMEADGSNQKLLIRGSSASWSPAVAPMNSHGAPQSRQIVFHASASGLETPIRPDPGAPTSDSDLFLLNVDDCLQYLYVQSKANCRDLATNITKDLEPGPLAPDYNKFSPPGARAIHEDADWSPDSPDGTKIVFTSHRFCEPSPTDNCNNFPDTEIYTINTDGTELTQLTHIPFVEERAPAWSPDGSQIAFMCRIGAGATFEICVIDSSGDAMGTFRLTRNPVLDATPSWSPDGTQIVFHRPQPQPASAPPLFQLWVVKADTICPASGVCDCPVSGKYPNGQCEMQLTNPLTNPPTNTLPGVVNAFPHWGVLRVHVPKK